MAEESTIEQSAPGKPGGIRSINFPFIPLEEALVRAKKFWDAERKNAAPVSSAAKHWGYGQKSSGVRQTVSALIQFGLMADQGSNENRMVRLTDQAIDLLIMPPDDLRRKKLLQSVARTPRIYSELLTKWPNPVEPPSDHTLAYFLQKEKNLNPNSVGGFIEDFKATIRFAGLMEPDTLPRQEPERSGSEDKAGARKLAKVAVGDFVQWASGGVDQFPIPRRITSIADDGKFAFVDRTSTGLPIEELTVVNEAQAKQPTPTVTPIPPAADVVIRKAGTKQDVFSLDEGQVVLQWPEGMSETSYADFKDWIDLQLRKIGRNLTKAN